jgi:hypothetical protein
MPLRILSCLLANSLGDNDNNGALVVAAALAGSGTTSSKTRTRFQDARNANHFRAFADNSGIVIACWCRSNDAHIAWRQSDANNLHGGDDSNDNYLLANIMDFDEPNMETLGLQRDESNNTSGWSRKWFDSTHH